MSTDYIMSVLGNHGEILSWISFLEKIGVKKGIVVERVCELITKVSFVRSAMVYPPRHLYS